MANENNPRYWKDHHDERDDDNDNIHSSRDDNNSKEMREDMRKQEGKAQIGKEKWHKDHGKCVCIGYRYTCYVSAALDEETEEYLVVSTTLHGHNIYPGIDKWLEMEDFKPSNGGYSLYPEKILKWNAVEQAIKESNNGK